MKVEAYDAVNIETSRLEEEGTCNYAAPIFQCGGKASSPESGENSTWTSNPTWKVLAPSGVASDPRA
jgi:hypothetical protein